jgi:hypothetical protein
MGDKPFVAIPVSPEILAAMRSESVSGAMARAIPELETPLVQTAAARSEVRSLENFEGYSELKPVLQGALDILAKQYLIPPQALEIFKTIHVDETLKGEFIVAPTSEVPNVRISEEFVFATKDDLAGQRVLARRLARFLDEREAALAGAEGLMISTLGLRLDLFRFLGETEEEREQDLAFYKRYASLRTGEVDFYEAAHKAMQPQETALTDEPAYRTLVLRDTARRVAIDALSPSLFLPRQAGEDRWGMDELLLREEALRQKQLKEQVEAFKTQGFFNGAGRDHPEEFWRYASLDFLRALVSELTTTVRDSRHRMSAKKLRINWGSL